MGPVQGRRGGEAECDKPPEVDVSHIGALAKQAMHSASDARRQTSGQDQDPKRTRRDG